MKAAPMIATLLFAPMPAFADPSLPSFSNQLAEAKCLDDWTKRGNVDRKMFNYCMEKQNDGYADARDHLTKYREVPMIDEIVASAVDNWLSPSKYAYEMVAYQIEKEGEAFYDLAYDVKAGKYTDAQVNACAQDWLGNRDPQWTMVVYCLERD